MTGASGARSILHAPLIHLAGLGSAVYAKVEYLHPSGSIKDRAIPAVLEARKQSGAIGPGQRIAVLSAGAGALSVTWAAARLGHQTIAVLPSTAPPHIVRLIRWMGGTCHLIDPAEIGETVGRLHDDPSVYYLSQADEPEIVDHYRPIADEILAELGEVDAITVGIGTGASISGIGRGVRDSPGADCHIVGVEPAEAPVASGGTWAPHTIHGLAPPMPQTLLDRSVLTEIMQVPSATAWRYARDVLRDCALPIGPSAGATVAAAVKLQARGAQGPIVAVCACSIYAYLDVAPDLDIEQER